ncbi:MAG: enoyl-CoA hydratase/isomerase family protein [Solirubrobacterales bacterium]
MPSHETIDVRIEGAAATIELNRPDQLNAWDLQLGTELHDAVKSLAGDDDVRAVMITGAGRAFSSGADLKEERSADDGLPDLGERLKSLYNPIILEIREMPKPVVAAVNGPAVGVGCALALACDLIVAAESAYFLLAFVNIGLVPDGGSSATVPARAGFARAAEMAMLGERVAAPQALEWGLVNRVVPDDQLGAEGVALRDRLAAGPTRSYANTKRLLNRRLLAGLDDQLDAEADFQSEQGRSADFVEGVLSFVQKREANFTGS